ncbi:MAG: insulinase family protein [Lachnospiraceae bacterium]|jgi:Zn-dependent M16 (insulinase) family peptidase
MEFKNLPQYELIMQEDLPDIQSTGYLLRHKKSGARVMLVSNEDENKVFQIGFRTPPANSTGVAHILEHSVLCGSREFPLKDPFVELVKGSLNTFLNAMTYPDKTIYPVASCNEQDFKNLMHVYLDAVFFPNIYEKEEIFRQEGWTYHLENVEDPITYNGVVYNEMKGAFSSPEDVLDRAILNSLFPDNTYANESGGDPDVIPELKYSQFLDFHSRYYHPANSYIYLYGKMDMEERLKWMDEKYLSLYDAIAVDSAIQKQEPFTKRKEIVMDYPISESEPQEDNSYLSWNVVIADNLDPELCVAFDVLDYTLLSAPGAPLKQALLDAKIGKDIIGSYEDGLCQPFFSVVAKNSNEKDKGRFLTVIEETLSSLAENGLDRDSLAAGINYLEFRFREADFGSYPKGLMYGIDVLSSWLYDDTKPFVHLKLLQVFENLKKKAKEGYFEELIKKYLLHNTHASVVIINPKRGLAAEREKALEEKLAAYKASLSQTELEEMVRRTHALTAYQEAEEDPENLEKIPMLRREDISRESVTFYNEKRKVGDTNVLYHNIYTNGIGYLTLLFDTEQVPDELVPYMGILKSVLAYVDTEHYTYGQLFHTINANSGGISCGLQVFNDAHNREKCKMAFGVRSKMLYSKVPFVFDMIKEILTTSKLDDEKRLYEIVAQMKSRLQISLGRAGHSSAYLRALSYFSPSGYFQEQTGGIAFYKRIDDLECHFEERKEDLFAKLKELMFYIFRPENLMVDFTADEEGYGYLAKELESFSEILHTQDVQPGHMEYRFVRKNEGFKTSGQVQYVARAGNFVKEGYEYTGALRILKTILSYEYLWTNIRVKGGAYGCMSGFRRCGDTYLVSYRDPHLSRTLDVFEGTPDYIRQFTADEREMTKYIIGTISELDVPMNPAAKGALSLSAYYSHITEKEMQQERLQILDAQQEDIRKLADIVDAVLKEENLCVIGGESKIEEAKELFNEVKYLL